MYNMYFILQMCSRFAICSSPCHVIFMFVSVLVSYSRVSATDISLSLVYRISECFVFVCFSPAEALSFVRNSSWRTSHRVRWFDDNTQPMEQGLYLSRKYASYCTFLSIVYRRKRSRIVWRVAFEIFSLVCILAIHYRQSFQNRPQDVTTSQYRHLWISATLALATGAWQASRLFVFTQISMLRGLRDTSCIMCILRHFKRRVVTETQLLFNTSIATTLISNHKFPTPTHSHTLNFSSATMILESEKVGAKCCLAEI